ncbi:MAG: CoA transferase [Acidimicrobiia bacterium]|nr:CoA transferase [Acidimicrobiia bacterium]
MISRATPSAALSHLRVCDLTTGFTGPSATRWLAAFGAEVIKVENLDESDTTRLLPPFAPGRSGLERSAQFNNLNVGKLGLAVDLSRRRGRNLVAELAAISQIICVDHPGLGSSGLDAGKISELRPGDGPEPIIAVGPETDRRTPGLWLELATAILLAVHRQMETGLGATVLTGEIAESEVAPPGGAVHPCLDGHVAIECRDDGDRAALAVAMGFDGADAGRRGRALTDDEVARWCNGRSRWTVESELQAVGVPVAVLRLPGERVDTDIATGARGLWPMVDHPDLGGIRVEGLAVELSKTSWSIIEPAPLLGQDTHWILSRLLGRPDPEIERLQHLGVIG